MSWQVAATLRELGVQRGDRVVIYLDNSVETAVSPMNFVHPFILLAGVAVAAPNFDSAPSVAARAM